ncbi:MAG TPA: DNA repair protein RecO [Polyangiales bacterium]|nr:DNA repair protein RecO [Polyangiales bacterium]
MRAHARQTEHADAVLLRSVDYAEADRVVTLLTSRHGKVSLMARGARRSKKRFGGALEPFSLLDVELSIGGSDVGTLHAASVTRAFPVLLRDLARMSAAGAALELVREVLPDRSPDPAIFASTVSMFDALERGVVPAEPLLLAFAAHVMGLSGFAPRLSACGLCGKRPARGQAAEFDPARGFLVCRSCGGAARRLSGAMRELLVSALEEHWLPSEASASASVASKDELDEAERALAAFIEHRIERPFGQGLRLLRR